MKAYKYLLILFVCLFIHQNCHGTDFPYRLYKTDLAASFFACGLIGACFAINNRNDDVSLPDRGEFNVSSVNRFDRSATDIWNPEIDLASDYGLLFCMMAPTATALQMVKNGRRDDFLTFSAIYGETVLFTLAFSEFTKSVFPRNRPYLYNTSIDEAEYKRLIKDTDRQRSFFSRHTALAFGSAVFLSKTASDLYGPNRTTALVWTISLSAATAVGISRYISGQHFPSDVLAGAAVGSLTGYTVPRLHSLRKRRIELAVTQNTLTIKSDF